jgi:hypothetical protein
MNDVTEAVFQAAVDQAKKDFPYSIGMHEMMIIRSALSASSHAERVKEMQAERDEALAHIKVLEKQLQSIVYSASNAPKKHGFYGVVKHVAFNEPHLSRLKEALSRSPSQSLAEHDKRVRAEERERCAQVADEMAMHSMNDDVIEAAQMIAAGIRQSKEGQ